MSEAAAISKTGSKKSKYFALGWSMTIHSALMYFMTAGLVADGLNVVIPSYEAAYGITRGQMNMAAAAAGWIGIIGVFIFAGIVMKKGPKSVTIVSLILAGITVIIFGQMKTITGFALCLIAIRFVVSGIGFTTTNTLVSNWFIKKRGIAFGIATIGLPLATAIYVPIASILIQRFSIGTAFLIIGIVIIAMAPITYFWIKNTPEEAGLSPDNADLSDEEIARLKAEVESPASDWTVAKLLKNKEVWLISLSYGFLFVVTIGIVTQLVPRMMDQGYEMNKAVGYLSAAAVIGIIGSYLWGWLDQKFSVRSASVVYCIWYIIAIGLLLTGGKSTTFLAIFFVGIALGGIGNLSPSMVAYTFGRSEFASVSRIIGVIVGIVSPLGFAIMGISYDKTQSYDTGYMVLIGFAVVAAVLIFLVRKNYNPDLEVIGSP